MAIRVTATTKMNFMMTEKKLFAGFKTKQKMILGDESIKV